MKDEEGNEIVDDAVDGVVEDAVEDAVEDKKDDGMTDGIPTAVSDVIDRVAEEMKTEDDKEENADDDDEIVVDDDTTEVVEDGDTVDLTAFGYDAEKIEAIKAIDPDILKDLAGLLSATDIKEETTEVVDDEAKLDNTEQVKTGGLTDEQLATLEKENPVMYAVVKSLNDQVGVLTSSLNTVADAEVTRRQTAESQEHVRNYNSANKKMDELREDFPIFGEYKKLPLKDGTPDGRHRSVIERTALWDTAQKLLTAGVVSSFDDGLNDAIDLYKAKNASKLALRKVASELKGRAKKITNRPTSKKSKPKTHAPGSDAQKLDIMTTAFEEAGLE
jgi:hypothetical protein